MERIFRHVAAQISAAAGSACAFLGAATIVVVWGVAGPVFGYSDAWQLVINTGSTIVPFLMVCLIQNTQNRDALAMQLKLDELVKSQQGGRNALTNFEAC